MNGEQLPRVWVGDLSRCPPFWLRYTRRWIIHSMGHDRDMLRMGDFFVPGNQPEPTIDPAEMKTIETAKEVDWT